MTKMSEDSKKIEYNPEKLKPHVLYFNLGVPVEKRNEIEEMNFEQFIEFYEDYEYDEAVNLFRIIKSSYAYRIYFEFHKNGETSEKYEKFSNKTDEELLEMLFFDLKNVKIVRKGLEYKKKLIEEKEKFQRKKEEEEEQKRKKVEEKNEQSKFFEAKHKILNLDMEGVKLLLEYDIEHLQEKFVVNTDHATIFF